MRTRGHRQPITSAVASTSGSTLFSCGKDGCIVRSDLSSGKQISVFYKQRRTPSTLDKGKGKATEEIRGHTDEVLALALSDDGKYLASGGKDRKLVVWDAEKGEWIRSFFGHKDTISVRN